MPIFHLFKELQVVVKAEQKGFLVCAFPRAGYKPTKAFPQCAFKQEELVSDRLITLLQPALSLDIKWDDFLDSIVDLCEPAIER